MTLEQDAEQYRQDMIHQCEHEVYALLHEASLAGVNRADVVIVIADRRDPIGDQIAHVCLQFGYNVDQETEVCVLGFPRNVALDILSTVHSDSVAYLEMEPPVGMAHLYCFAYQGLTVKAVGIQHI